MRKGLWCWDLHPCYFIYHIIESTAHPSICFLKWTWFVSLILALKHRFIFSATYTVWALSSQVIFALFTTWPNPLIHDSSMGHVLTCVNTAVLPFSCRIAAASYFLVNPLPVGTVPYINMNWTWSPPCHHQTQCGRKKKSNLFPFKFLWIEMTSSHLVRVWWRHSKLATRFREISQHFECRPPARRNSWAIGGTVSKDSQLALLFVIEDRICFQRAWRLRSTTQKPSSAILLVIVYNLVGVKMFIGWKINWWISQWFYNQKWVYTVCVDCTFHLDKHIVLLRACVLLQFQFSISDITVSARLWELDIHSELMKAWKYKIYKCI